MAGGLNRSHPEGRFASRRVWRHRFQRRRTISRAWHAIQIGAFDRGRSALERAGHRLIRIVEVFAAGRILVRVDNRERVAAVEAATTLESDVAMDIDHIAQAPVHPL